MECKCCGVDMLPCVSGTCPDCKGKHTQEFKVPTVFTPAQYEKFSGKPSFVIDGLANLRSERRNGVA